MDKATAMARAKAIKPVALVQWGYEHAKCINANEVYALIEEIYEYRQEPKECYQKLGQIEHILRS